jgi:FkbM family methyltransferase
LSIKTTIKRWLEKSGWYVRKTDGISIGVDLFRDLKRFGVYPKCVFDIGAHHGQSAIEYVNEFPGSRVFAFEPVASNFAVLTSAAHQMITPVLAAVGDRAGKADIAISKNNSQAHSLSRNLGGATETVDIITIDDFCSQRGLQPDFIKIDVEGFEMKVLAGATRTLTDKNLRAVVSEATLGSTNGRHTHLADLCSSLQPYGFRLVAIYDQSVWETTGQLEFFNALFVKR